MHSYHQEFTTLSQAVHVAGRRVIQLACEGFDTFTKKDRSPVTTADLEVDQLLRQHLLTAFPHDGWLSEETPDDLNRVDKRRIWIVDPIDGTKYFIVGLPQFTISVALVENGEPVMAMILNPATKELFSAIQGSGAMLNGQSIFVRSTEEPRLTLLVNPPALKQKTFPKLETSIMCRPMGSIAYTLALIAAGRADATIHLGRQNEWDIAAGVLLVQEAGGSVVDTHGSPLCFNQPDPSVKGVIACRMDQASFLQKLVRNLTNSEGSR